MRRGAGELAAAAAGVAFGMVGLVAACGGPTGTPSASPGDPVDGAAIARTFVATLTDPALSASVVQQTTAAAASGIEALELRTTIGGDLALPDLDLEVVIESAGEVTGFGIVVVGGRTYANLGEGWVEAPAGSVETDDLVNALVVVTDPADLAYAGTETVDGVTLHHLVAVGPLPYVPGGLTSSDGATGTIEGLDAYATADGTPVSMSFAFTTTATDDAGTTTVRGTTETRFTDVGGDRTIAPPSLAP